MTIVRHYNVGDNVVIEPYNIFNNPEPIKWTNDAYGYGYEYKPNDRLIYSKPLDIFGQYDPVYLHYFIIDQQNNVQNIIYENRIGSRLEIAGSFYSNDGFVSWNTPNGDILLSSDYIILTSNISACISCQHEYKLTYDSNGGSGKMNPQFGIYEQWVDVNDFLYKHSYPLITLLDNNFIPKRTDLQFNGWIINNEYYQPDDIIELTSNLTAYAVWQTQTKYYLTSHVKCVNLATTFRYIMLNIISTRNNTSINFSKVQFLNETNTPYVFSDVQICSSISESQKQEALNLIMGTSNFQVTSTIFPYQIKYDLGIQKFNASNYNKWRWHTASNSSSNTSSNIKHIQLLFSNDNIHWFLADDITDETNAFPTGNNVIAYSSEAYDVNYYSYDF